LKIYTHPTFSAIFLPSTPSDKSIKNLKCSKTSGPSTTNFLFQVKFEESPSSKVLLTTPIYRSPASSLTNFVGVETFFSNLNSYNVPLIQFENSFDCSSPDLSEMFLSYPNIPFAVHISIEKYFEYGPTLFQEKEQIKIENGMNSEKKMGNMNNREFCEAYDEYRQSLCEPEDPEIVYEIPMALPEPEIAFSMAPPEPEVAELVLSAPPSRLGAAMPMPMPVPMPSFDLEPDCAFDFDGAEIKAVNFFMTQTYECVVLESEDDYHWFYDQEEDIIQYFNVNVSEDHISQHAVSDEEE